MNKHKIKYKFLSLFLLLFPLIIGLQPFFPKPFQLFFISLRLIIIPVVALLFTIRKRVNIIWVFLFVPYFLIASIWGQKEDAHSIIITFLSLLSSIIFFQLGNFLATKRLNQSIFKNLTYGVTIFNSLSLVVYILILLGKVDINTLYHALNRVNDIGLERFSLGNAIEIPFVITSLLFISIILQDSSKFFFLETLLNLIIVLISSSRIVVIIALLLFVIEFNKISFKGKVSFILIIILLISGIPFVVKLFEMNFDLLISRFFGTDAGSGIDRLFIYNKFYEHFLSTGLFGILFGKGLISSLSFMQQITGAFRTPESVFLQLFYETGIFGVLIVLWLPIKKDLNYLLHGKYRLPLFFIFIQLLGFLPIFSMMPIVFLLLGVCSGSFVHIYEKMNNQT